MFRTVYLYNCRNVKVFILKLHILKFLRVCLEAGFDSEKCQFFDETRRLVEERTLRYGRKKQRWIIKKVAFVAQSLTSKHTLKEAAPFLFFSLYLILGLMIYGDYGMSWDEELQRRHGLVSAKYVDDRVDDTKEVYTWQDLPTYEHRFYGVWFSLPAVWLEKALGLESFRAQFRMRHLLVFLIFWLSALLFYRLLKERFGHWGWALLGAAMLVLCPRIFAHSFYNPKDLPFLSLYILGSYSLFRFWLRPNTRSALFHGLAGGMLIAMRVTGVILPVVTLFLVGVDMVLNRRLELNWYKKYARGLLIYLPATAFFTVLFWPYLWEHPWRHFLDAFETMSQYSWGGTVIFRGQFLDGEAVPWYYIPYWMGISIPVVYLVLAGGGFLLLFPPVVANLQGNPWRLWDGAEQRKDWAMLALLLAPLAAIIVKDSVVYDGWRHLFFIYPCLVYLMVYGLYRLWILTEGRRPGWRYALACITALGLASTAWFMVRYHPHQNVYFNELAPGDQLGQFDLDYWGLAYKEGFEALGRIDQRKKIKVACNTFPGALNWRFLKPGLKARFEILDKSRVEEADYFMSDFRHWAVGLQQYREHKGLFGGEEVYAVRVGETKVLVVYTVGK